MRSSAIFPLLLRKKKIESIYTFMGYWLKKRNISLVTAIFTIRDDLGNAGNDLTDQLLAYTADDNNVSFYK